ncbi:cyclic GMP-AMP synthase [Astyanax mexicanus]|uniref:Cyclic GMP-AMP synthase-like n=1 Tax=Astyanax mexicanus TaxID=7994 RepID=W5LN70_ASTMX|nr:cyclic GMP-AMP synthase [Astyanax mexicanus]XP_022539021.1 cyclic GMP-AMP synthase [Astyanax mexicanus]
MALDIPSITPELDRLIRQRGRDLRLRQVDKQQAARLVNKLKTDLLKFLKDNQEQPFFRDVSPITTGSYFELVKIIKPNEFDIMLKLQTSSRLTWKALEKYNGAFYTVSLQRPARSEIRHFLLEDERTISSSKIMKEMHNLVQRFIKSYQVPAGEGRWVVHRRQINSPAVTLGLVNEDDGTEIMSVDIVPALEVPQGWPEAARAGPDVDKWLGKNTRRKFVAQPVYFVPKRPKQRNLSDVEKESWRISFSHIEKEMLRFHGNRRTCCERNEIRCCRKECLRLLKCLFEGLKERYKLEHLCSYHGKTAFFHNLSVRCEDSLWTPGQLSHCFMRLLCDFENSANKALLPHFFVRNYNLFSPSVFPKRSLMVLTSALKEQREEGFPLLQVRRPPAIGYNPAPPAQPQEVPEEPNTVTPKNDTVTSQHSSFTFTYVTVACIMLFMAVGCALYVKI